MEYKNPEIPEGINTSTQHPLKDFFLLSAGILGGITVCAFLLGLFAEHLALHVPFSLEQEIMTKIEIEDGVNNHPEIQDYLEQLTSELLPHMDLPEEITVNVNYIDEPVENAFATLGGHISIYRGLIDLLPNENALAMVLAHEIAHVKHRDPIVALGRGVVVGLFLSAIAGISTDNIVGNVISDTGTLTILGFNRKQEHDADVAALEALANHYGHIAGADALFKALLTLEDEFGLHTAEFFSTHPLSEDRITNIHDMAKQNNWPLTGKIKMFPAFITPESNEAN